MGEEDRLKKAKKAARDSTTLVRLSRVVLARIRDESKRSGVPQRTLIDRACQAYLDRPAQ